MTQWSRVAHTQHTKTMGERYDYDGSSIRLPNSSGQSRGFRPRFSLCPVRIESKAKRLNRVSTHSARRMVHRDRFATCFCSSALPPHRLYPLPVVQRGQSVDGYWYLHLPQIFTGLTESTTIHDAEKTLESRDEILALDVIPIYTPIRFGYFFVSYSLRQAIESANLTGIDLVHPSCFEVANKSSPNNRMQRSRRSGRT